MYLKNIWIGFLFFVFSACQNSGSSGKMNVESTKSFKTVYDLKFDEKMKELPNDFFVLDGQFLPKKLGNNYALFLIPRPLDSYGLLFGPDTIKSSVIVSADIFGSERGKTVPSFGVGTHGATGFRLYLRGAREGMVLQIIYNDNLVIASIPYTNWRTDSWTSMKLFVHQISPSEVSVYGKAWPQDQPESDWMVKYTGKLKIEEGPCSIWGIPYSGRDLFYDNLKIETP